MTSAIHTYEPDDEGRCQGGWVSSDGYRWVECNSTQRSSVLHDDAEAAFREKHFHDGGDCMCFEADDGPTYQQAMEAYTRGVPVADIMAEHEHRYDRIDGIEPPGRPVLPDYRDDPPPTGMSQHELVNEMAYRHNETAGDIGLADED